MISKTRHLGLFLWALALCHAAYAVEFAGGTGEPNDPYQIATAEQLIAMGEDPTLYDRHFLLILDIDLDPNLPGRKVFDRAVIAPDHVSTNAWRFDGKPFTGVFDGGGHTIKNLKIVGEDYLGLFGQLGLETSFDMSAVIRNLTVINVQITASGDSVGGLVGRAVGVLSDCHSMATVKGHWDVGGLAGSKWGIMKNCSSEGIVAGEDGVGGLLGRHGWKLKLLQ